MLKRRAARYPRSRIPKVLQPWMRKPDDGDVPEHRAWLKQQPCLINNSDCRLPMDPHHVRNAANAGMGMTPPDWYCVPLCRTHHDEYHAGQETFAEKYCVDALAKAAEYAARSPALKRKMGI